ncbi:hypothetical protein [Maricaulis sp. D1M11]|uniref:hypothetical protein n=1 Tax=Maricaulis sp. D1M11 TaxID=3076117 RepID=UPI0039B5E11F
MRDDWLCLPPDRYRSANPLSLKRVEDLRPEGVIFHARETSMVMELFWRKFGAQNESSLMTG